MALAVIDFTLADPTRAAGPAQPLRTRNVILVTADGLRIQELFGGMDPVVAASDKRSGIYDPERTRSLFWRPTPRSGAPP